MQILTPDFSGRRPPHHPPLSPPPLSPLPFPHPTSPLLLLVFLPPSLPPSLPPPSSQVPLRPVVTLWHAVSVEYLAAALAHSHCLTVSPSHCLTVSLSLISLISLISFSSLSSLSHLSHLSLSSLSLSLSLLSVSRLSVSLLSLLSQEDPGKEPHIKDSSPLPPKERRVFSYLAALHFPILER